jgi:nucleosome binding factor SPN SPT16 subunit
MEGNNSIFIKELTLKSASNKGGQNRLNNAFK